ncbi:TMV resistance protein N [Medicago truncatula]|uniref:TMV resistance protein N n=1 Tax=Medicago truncatula TaxID=3880 RepID=UPI000D2F14CA|nr:TMV resistance protein N [Medicago truncatula]
MIHLVTSMKEEYEYEFIKKIVTVISNKINRVLLHVADHPVGLESRLLQVKSLLDVDCDNGVGLIGIYGSGGLGKTTLTRAVYNLIADQFEGLCFLHNVRENSVKYGLEYLQEQLLSKSIGLEIKLGHVSKGIPIIKERLHQKKILLILDDVDKLKQLQVLVGEPSWLGPGSRVIITTRDKHLLSCHGIKRIYEVDFLNKDEALELFRWMAFKSNHNDSSYDYILNSAVKYASGLPLALEVVGSSLFGKCTTEWESTLQKYERIPHEDIQNILRVSYDALDEEQQSVFLDIACCFKGCKLTEVQKILHARYDHCIKSHVGVLVDKALMKINFYGFVALHDLIEDMGKEIVRQESPKEPGKRSRLWFHEDIVHGTRKIEIIRLSSLSTEETIDWNGKAFQKMKGLKALIIENGHFSKAARYLPSSLRLLKWNRCPSKSLSSIFLNKKFEYMKVLSFNDCQYLTDLPDVSGLQNLEKFSFENCNNLITIHNSIGFLNKLETLNAKGCIKLESFPPLQLTSLKKLELSICKSLKSFPELVGRLTNIKDIWLYGTSIGELPFSFQNFSELAHLYLSGCGKLRFSSFIFMMPKLSKITAKDCRLVLPKLNDKLNSTLFSNVEYLNLGNNSLSDECVPIILRLCANVKYLYLPGNDFKILPECLNECHLIRILELDGCKNLEEIKGIPPNLKKFSAIQCKSLTSSCIRMLLSQQLHEAGCTDICLPTRIKRIPDWFEHQSGGQTISFWFCKKIPSISSIFLFSFPESFSVHVRDNITIIVNLFVNGYKYTLSDDVWFVSRCPKIQTDHTYLFDLELEELIKRYRTYRKLMSKLEEALLKNEWIHVELKFGSCLDLKCSQDSNMKLSCITQIGIHMFKEKRSMEEDVVFTNPYGKRKLDEYLNTSLSQFLPPLKKDRFVDVGIPETEILQRHHLALLSMQQKMALLPQRRRITLLSRMWNLVLNETKEKEHQG